MKKVLLDTGIWARTLYGKEGLSNTVLRELASGVPVYVSPISVYEIAQKCRIGKWDSMIPYLDRLPSILTDQGAQWVSLSPEVLLNAARLEWDHRDPFDRIVVSTARQHGLHVVTTDQVIRDYLGSDFVII